jgi:hypothetical protein
MELKIVMNDHCKLLIKCCYFLDRLKIQDGHQRGPSMVPIHPVVLEKEFVLHISHRVAMLNYVPRWWPSWIFNQRPYGKYVKQTSSQEPLDGLEPYLAEMFLAGSLSSVVTFCEAIMAPGSHIG